MTIPDGYIRSALVEFVQGEIRPGAAAYLSRQAAEYGFQVVEIDGERDPRETQRRLVKRAAWAVTALEQRYGPGIADTCTLYVSPDLTPVEVDTARRVAMLVPSWREYAAEPLRTENPRKVTVRVEDSWTRRIAIWAARKETSENKSN